MESLEFQTRYLGTYLWAGLATYVITTDMYALVKEKETLSEAFGRAMAHPGKRWFVMGAWILTTKHLFFRKYLAWLDPFALMALTVKIFKRESNYG